MSNNNTNTNNKNNGTEGEAIFSADGTIPPSLVKLKLKLDKSSRFYGLKGLRLEQEIKKVIEEKRILREKRIERVPAPPSPYDPNVIGSKRGLIIGGRKRNR